MFINTMDKFGDEATMDMIIERTITEYCDNSAEKIGEYAFYGCTALGKVDVPNAEYLANFSFYGCTALKTVNIQNAVTIGDSVFAECETLESVTAPSLVTINSSDFKGCKSLKIIILPSLESMTSSSFSGCTSLEKADFAKLKSIGGTTFHNCPAFTALVLRNTEAVVKLSNVNALSGTNYIYVPKTMADGSDGVSAYKASTNWSSIDAERFRAIEDYPEICGG